MYIWLKNKISSVKLFKIVFIGLMKLVYDFKLKAKDAMVKVYIKFPFLIKKKYYVISRKSYSMLYGVFSNILYYLPLLNTARVLRLEPVVKMYNYNLNEKPEDLWPVFFEKTEKNARNTYILKKECYFNYGVEFNRGGVYKKIDLDRILKYDKDEVIYWNEVFSKYIHYNQYLEEALEKEYKKYFEGIHKSGKRILGVKLRGTDYTNSNPQGHYIQTTTTTMITRVKKIVEESGFDFIYLATEDENIVNDFKKEFSDEVLIIRNNNFINGYDKSKTTSAFEEAAKKFGEKESTLDYIKDTYLLTKTDSLITCGNSGSVMAIIMNGGRYEKVYFMNNGTFR